MTFFRKFFSYVLNCRYTLFCLHALIDLALLAWDNYGFIFCQACLALRFRICLIVHHTAFSLCISILNISLCLIKVLALHPQRTLEWRGGRMEAPEPPCPTLATTKGASGKSISHTANLGNSTHKKPFS